MSGSGDRVAAEDEDECARIEDLFVQSRRLSAGQSPARRIPPSPPPPPPDASAAAAAAVDVWQLFASIPGPVRRLAARERAREINAVAGGPRPVTASALCGGGGGGGGGVVGDAVDLTAEERSDEWERAAALLHAPQNAARLSRLLAADAADCPAVVDELLLRVDALSPHHASAAVSPALQAAAAEVERLGPSAAGCLALSTYLHALLSEPAAAISASIDAALCSAAAPVQVGSFLRLCGVPVLRSAYRQPHLLVRAEHIVAVIAPMHSAVDDEAAAMGAALCG